MNLPNLPRPRAAERVVAAPAGELDLATADELKAVLAGETSAGGQVVLDLSPVTFMDATALGVIVGAANQLARKGGRLTLTGATPPIERVLHLTGLHTMLVALPTR